MRIQLKKYLKTFSRRIFILLKNSKSNSKHNDHVEIN